MYRIKLKLQFKEGYVLEEDYKERYTSMDDAEKIAISRKKMINFSFYGSESNSKFGVIKEEYAIIQVEGENEKIVKTIR